MPESESRVPTVIGKGVVLEADCVRILDRRTFPLSTSYVVCRTCEDVAVAIEDMVTQSNGPFFAAGAGLILAAREAQHLAPIDSRLSYMRAARDRLLRTRPTNNNIRDVVAKMMDGVAELAGEQDFAARLEARLREVWEWRKARGRLVGERAAAFINDGDTVLTHCWAESSFIETLAAAVRQGRRPSVICTETRPYLQGARLTAHSVAEMGLDVTVITDNMAAHAMACGKVSCLMTAADRVTLSGHVINKIGTLQLAIAARHFALPFVALVQAPDRQARTPADVPIEERDSREVLTCLGIPTASPLARGWYPAFDVTPPEFVSAVATCEGVFAPVHLRAAYA
jgi:methylthioribose-1-phosphate isomerase